MDELRDFLSKIEVLTADIYSSLLCTYGETFVREIIDEMINTSNFNMKKFDYYISKIIVCDDIVFKDLYSAYSLDMNLMPSFTSDENKKRATEIHDIVVEIDNIINKIDSNITDIWISDRVEACISICGDEDTLKKLNKLYSKFIYKRNELVEGNLKLVVSFSKTFCRRGIDFNEVVQLGNIGLMRAIEKFDPKFNTSLSTYAYYWIRQNITREIVNVVNPISVPYSYVTINISISKAIKILNSELGREPTNEEIANYLNISKSMVDEVRRMLVDSISLNDSTITEDGDYTILDTIEDENANIENKLVKKEMIKELFDYLQSELTEKEYNIICHRFSIDGYSFMTLEELGQLYGVTREWIRQIENRTKSKIRKSRKLRKYVL